MNMVNATRSPSCMWPGHDLARADEHHDARPPRPSAAVADRPISEVAVSVCRMLSRIRCTPPAKTSASRALRVVSLDDAHAAQRFGEPSGDLGSDLAALAEDRADIAERLEQQRADHHHDSTAPCR